MADAVDGWGCPECHVAGGHWPFCSALDPEPEGCCTDCRGTGVNGDPTTGGQCWDCRGTGHPHAPEERP